MVRFHFRVGCEVVKSPKYTVKKIQHKRVVIRGDGVMNCTKYEFYLNDSVCRNRCQTKQLLPKD